MKTIVIGATGKEYRLLRAKAVETISIIGLAVGKEKFAQDAMVIISYIKPIVIILERKSEFSAEIGYVTN